jgi:probable F420-dependent oxidoreductase
MNLGRVGVWTGQLRGVELGEVGDAAAAVESFGYGALWLPGGGGGDVLDRCDAALAATSSLRLATGILNVWRHDPTEVAAITARLQEQHGGRFLLGLGVSHQRLIGDEYLEPLKKMSDFLDQLDAAGQPAGERVLAALRRRMLELARDRAGGSHPYFVPPEHTATARAILGSGPLLAPEQAVVLNTDPAAAREVARRFCELYLQMPNYTNNLRALGFGDDDLTAPGSDRLIDAIVVWGDEEAIATRVRAHLDAGADHVCIQVLGAGDTLPIDTWRILAPALT